MILLESGQDLEFGNIYKTCHFNICIYWTTLNGYMKNDKRFLGNRFSSRSRKERYVFG